MVSLQGSPLEAWRFGAARYIFYPMAVWRGALYTLSHGGLARRAIYFIPWRLVTARYIFYPMAAGDGENGEANRSDGPGAPGSGSPARQGVCQNTSP